MLLCSFSLHFHCRRVELCSWIHDLKWFCKKWWWCRKIARWQRRSPRNGDWQFLSQSFELRLSFILYYMISNVFDSFRIRLQRHDLFDHNVIFTTIPVANSSFILSASSYLNTRPIPPISPIESYPINQTSKGKDLIQDNNLPNRTVNTLVCHQAFWMPAWA